MRRFSKIVSTTSLIAVAIAGLGLGSTTYAASHGEMSNVEKGKKLAFDRKKGNCLACHMITGGDLPGNIAPPLIAMKQRFPDRAVLRAQIYDATVKNPNTIMPPFGRHKVLSSEEIDLITDFIHQL